MPDIDSRTVNSEPKKVEVSAPNEDTLIDVPSVVDLADSERNSNLDKKETEAEGKTLLQETQKEKPSSSKRLLTPMLGSIDELMEETEKEMGEINNDKIPIDLEEVKKLWQEHQDSVESPSTKATLEKVLISISEESIHVIVPSSVSKEEVSQEIQLYQKLREKFNNQELNIIIDIDRAQFPDLAENSNTKMYTMKEKFDYLSEKNPELNNLVKKLKLKIDQE